jgi:hypothetical protein
MRLVERRRMDHGSHALHAVLDEPLVGNVPDLVGKRGRLEIHSDRGFVAGLKPPQQGFPEVARASGH